MKNTQKNAQNTQNAKKNAPKFTPKTLTPEDAKIAEFTCYMDLKLVMSMGEDKMSISDFIEKWGKLFAEYSCPLDEEIFVKCFVPYMCGFGMKEWEGVKEKSRFMKSVSSLRKFLKQEWDTVLSARFISKEGKAPVVKEKKSKAPTKKELEARLAELEARLANK